MSNAPFRKIFARCAAAQAKFSPCGAAQAKFSSTFFKRWQDSKGQRPLAAIRRWRNSLYFRRIWGFGGLYKRKAPKAPLFCARLGGGGLPDGEVAPQGPEGALAICLPAAAGGLGTEKFLSFGIFRLPPVVLEGLPLLKISRHPAGGVVGSRPDRRVTFLCKQESNQRSCQGASAGPLDPRRCRSRLAAAPGLQSRA